MEPITIPVAVLQELGRLLADNIVLREQVDGLLRENENERLHTLLDSESGCPSQAVFASPNGRSDEPTANRR